jgi:hypothetical protein
MTDSDTREVLLASLRADLIHQWDSGVVALNDVAIAETVELFAEHALDAALARGSTLLDVLAVLAAEEHRIEATLERAFDDLEPDDEDEETTYQLGPSAFTQSTELPGLAALQRKVALLGIASLGSALASNAMLALAREAAARNGTTLEDATDDGTPLISDDALPMHEAREVYLAALTTTT